MRLVASAWRRSLLAVVVSLATGVGAAPSVASAAGRVALVMGNSAYADLVRLANPANDASAVAAALARLGFDVTLLTDATRDTMHDALLAFAEESADADVALVFYAGHGLETADGRNYLVPVDARLADAGDLPAEVVSLDTIVDAVAGARVPIVILDAARNDPFARRGDPGTEGGTASLESTGAGVLIAYATLPGDVAGDGGPGDRHSPYTEAVLAHLEEPGVELEAMFRRVAAAVYAATEGEQHPAVVTTLTEPGAIRLADPNGRP